MFCPYCGKEILDTAKVCGYCGKPQKAKAEAAAEQAPPAPVESPPPPTPTPQPAAAAKPAKPPKPAKEKKTAGEPFYKKMPTWAWGLIGVVIIGVILFVTMGGGGNASQPAANPVSNPGGSVQQDEPEANDPFAGAVGTWISPDLDGSQMTLFIAKTGNSYSVTLTDSGASICGVDDNEVPLYGLTVKGSGVPDGTTLRIDPVSGNCAVTGEDVSFEFEVTYNAATDSISDPYDAPWERK